MTGHISVRESIRWLPDEPDEPTITIVLTSPGRLFVDLRLFKSDAWRLETANGARKSHPPSIPFQFTH